MELSIAPPPKRLSAWARAFACLWILVSVAFICFVIPAFMNILDKAAYCDVHGPGIPDASGILVPRIVAANVATVFTLISWRFARTSLAPAVTLGIAILFPAVVAMGWMTVLQATAPGIPVREDNCAGPLGQELYVFSALLLLAPTIVSVVLFLIGANRRPRTFEIAAWAVLIAGTLASICWVHAVLATWQ